MPTLPGTNQITHHNLRQSLPQSPTLCKTPQQGHEYNRALSEVQSPISEHTTFLQHLQKRNSLQSTEIHLTNNRTTHNQQQLLFKRQLSEPSFTTDVTMQEKHHQHLTQHKQQPTQHQQQPTQHQQQPTQHQQKPTQHQQQPTQHQQQSTQHQQQPIQQQQQPAQQQQQPIQLQHHQQQQQQNSIIFNFSTNGAAQPTIPTTIAAATPTIKITTTPEITEPKAGEDDTSFSDLKLATPFQEEDEQPSLDFGKTSETIESNENDDDEEEEDMDLQPLTFSNTSENESNPMDVDDDISVSAAESKPMLITNVEDALSELNELSANETKLSRSLSSSSSESSEQDSAKNTSTSSAKRTRSKEGKPKRIRTSFKVPQLLAMKELFDVDKNPDSAKLTQLAKQIDLPKRVLQVWFQNARAKHRKGQSIFSDNIEKLLQPEGPSSKAMLPEQEDKTEDHLQDKRGTEEIQEKNVTNDNNKLEF